MQTYGVPTGAMDGHAPVIMRADFFCTHAFWVHDEYTRFTVTTLSLYFTPPHASSLTQHLTLSLKYSQIDCSGSAAWYDSRDG